MWVDAHIYLPLGSCQGHPKKRLRFGAQQRHWSGGAAGNHPAIPWPGEKSGGV